MCSVSDVYKAHTTVTVTLTHTRSTRPQIPALNHTRDTVISPPVALLVPSPPTPSTHKPSTRIHRPHCSLPLVLCSHHSPLSLLSYRMVTVFCRVTRTTPSLSNTANASLSAFTGTSIPVSSIHDCRNSSNRTV